MITLKVQQESVLYRKKPEATDKGEESPTEHKLHILSIRFLHEGCKDEMLCFWKCLDKKTSKENCGARGGVQLKSYIIEHLN